MEDLSLLTSSQKRSLYFDKDIFHQIPTLISQGLQVFTSNGKIDGLTSANYNCCPDSIYLLLAFGCDLNFILKFAFKNGGFAHFHQKEMDFFSDLLLKSENINPKYIGRVLLNFFFQLTDDYKAKFVEIIISLDKKFKFMNYELNGVISIPNFIKTQPEAFLQRVICYYSNINWDLYDYLTKNYLDIINGSVILSYAISIKKIDWIQPLIQRFGFILDENIYGILDLEIAQLLYRQTDNPKKVTSYLLKSFKATNQQMTALNRGLQTALQIAEFFKLIHFHITDDEIIHQLKN